MGAKQEATCGDCYFRQEGLCALVLERPCPTFRASVSGRLAPPRHPQLVPVRARVRETAAA